MTNIYSKALIIALFFLLVSCDFTTAEDPTVENAVPSFAAKPIVAIPGDQIVELAWPSLYDAGSYTLYWSTQPDVSPTNANAIEVNTTNYKHHGLTNGVTYYYALIAHTDYGASKLSEVQSATPSLPELQAPSDFQAYAGDQRVTLNWTKLAQATSYTIFWEKGKAPDKNTTSQRIDFVTPPFVHENLDNGQVYQYIVTANIEDKIGKASAVVTATPNVAAALPPSEINYTRSNAEITLSWRVQDSESFTIYWGTASGVNSNSPHFANQLSPFVHANVDPAATYYYRIASNKGGVSGALSDEFVVPAGIATDTVVKVSGQAPGAPQPGFIIGDRQISLDWPALPNASTYNIYWSLSPDVSTASQAIYNVHPPYVHSGLTNNVRVYYRVSAQNNAGESALSTQISAAPEVAKPGVPLNLQLLSGETWVAATWLPVENAENYHVYYREKNAGSYSALTLGHAPALLQNLNSGTEYEVFVEAANLDQAPQSNPAPSDKTTSVYSVFTHSPPPLAPTELTATPGNKQVSLQWSAVGAGVSYNIYRNDGPQSKKVLKTNVTGTQYSDTGLLNGVLYSYVLTSVNTAGESRSSLEVNVAPHQPVPDAPSNVQILEGNKTLTVSWTAAASISAYNIYIAKSDAAESTKVYSNVSSPYTIGSPATNELTNGRQYRVYVTAVAVESNSTRESRQSAALYVTPHVAAPANAPGGLLLTASDANNLLEWSAVNGITQYRVYFSIDSDINPASSNFVETTNTNYTHDKIPGEGHIYYYAVAAINSGGEGPLAYFQPQVQAPPAPPQTPGDFTVQLVSQTSNQVVFDWTTANSNADSYAVYWSNDQTLPLTDWNKLSGVQPQDSHKQLTFGDTYYYRLAAINSIGETVSAQPQNIQPVLPPPNAPSGLQVAGGDGQVSLWWDQTSGVSYKLYWSPLGGTEQSVNNVHSMEAVNSLTNGTTYSFQVAGINLDGVEGARSAVVSATPNVVVANNTPPSFGNGNSQSVSVNSDGTTQYWALNATDPDDNVLTWSIALQPTQGSASITDTNGGIAAQAVNQTKYLRYTANSNASGTDVVIVKVTDASGAEALQTFTITLIQGPNSTPIFVDATPRSGTVNNSVSSLVWDVGAFDQDGDTLTWSISPAAQNKVTLSNLGALPAGSSDARRITYQPLVGQADGIDSFLITVDDGRGGSTQLDFSVDVQLQAVASMSVVSVPSNGSAGVANQISVTARDSSGASIIADTAQVHISVSGSNSRTGLATSFANGVYSANYTPTVAGSDLVSISMTSGGVTSVLTGSPFTINIAPGSFSSVTSTLPNSGIINTAMNFSFTAVDNNSNPISGLTFNLSVTDPSNATADIPLTDAGSGNYTASYTPTSAGNYTFSLAYNGQNVFAKIISVIDPVAGVPVVAASNANVPAGTAGSATAIVVEARDGNGNLVTTNQATVSITVSGANTVTAPLATNFNAGRYTASYTPTKAGTDLVAISMTIAGQTTALNNSPFTSVVGPGAFSSATNTLPASLLINQAMDFDISPVDANNNPLTGLSLTAAITRPSSALDTPVVAETSPGVYHVVYTVTELGSYQVDVKSGTSSFFGTPATVAVSAPLPVPASSNITVPATGTAGVASTLSLEAIDAAGNRVVDNQAVVTFSVSGVNTVASIATTYNAGIYTASYTPLKSGIDQITATMTVSGQQPVVLTPLNSTVNPNVYNSATNNLTATNLLFGDTLVFDVMPVDAYNNPLSGLTLVAEITTPNSVDLPAVTEQAQAGVYRVSYTPPLLGNYSVDVKLGTTSLFAAPASILVYAPLPVLANSTINVPATGTAGVVTPLSVVARDASNLPVLADQAVVTFSVSGVNSIANISATYDSITSSYNASYTPQTAGTDQITVSMTPTGQATADISAAQNSIVAAAGFDHVTSSLGTIGTINTPLDFTVSAFDAFNNRLSGLTFTATATDTATSLSQNLTVTEAGGGDYSVAFTPTLATTYSVDVLRNGASVLATPTMVAVTDPVAGIPDPAQSVITVPSPVVAGNLSTITVQVFDSNKALVTTDQAVVTITVGGDNPQTGALATTFSGGTYSASYTPTKAGADQVSISMSVNGAAAVSLNGSPFLSIIQPAAFSSSTNTIPTTPVLLNSSFNFEVRPVDQYSNGITGLSLAAEITAPSTQLATPPVTEITPGVYSVSYTPAELGNYAVDVKLAGASILGTAATVNVYAPLPDPTQSTAVVPTSGTAGVATALSLQARDSTGTLVIADQAQVSFSVSGVNNIASIPGVYSNGVYTASYTPQNAGADQITANMTVNGQAAAVVATLPSNVAPGPFNSSTHNIPTQLLFNNTLSFYVQPKDANNNALTGLAVAAQITSPGTSATPAVTENPPGTYNVSYLPPALGTYSVTMTAGTTSLLGGAVDVSVYAPLPSTTNSTATIPASGTAGVATPLSVNALDASGVAVIADQATVTFTVAGVNSASVSGVFDSATGKYNASYIPTTAGTDQITATMTVNGQAAVNLATLPSSVAAGPFASATTNLSTSPYLLQALMDFTVTLLDANSNNVSGQTLTAQVTTPSATVADATVVETATPGVYQITYTPTELGLHSINVQIAGTTPTPVFASPLTAQVYAPLPDPTQSTAIVPNSGTAGLATALSVQARDSTGTLVIADQAQVSFSVSGVNNIASIPAVYTGGIYSASYTPQNAGSDQVTANMTVKGQTTPVVVATLPSNVAPGSFTSSTHNIPTQLLLKNSLSFYVKPVDAYNNPLTGLTVVAQITATGVNATPVVTENPPGTYNVSYLPATLDTYSVTMTAGATSLLGGAVNVLVYAPPPSTATSTVSIPGAGTAGVATQLAVNALDASSLPVIADQATVTFTVAGVNSASVAGVFDSATGNYNASYLPTKSGTDQITATMTVNGQLPVNLATIPSNVVPGSFASSTNDITSPIALTSSIAFNVMPVDAFNNALTGLTVVAEITPPGATVPINPAVTEPTPGVYHVSYQPLVTGSFLVDMKSAGVSLLGTAATVVVDPPLPVAANSTVNIPANGTAGVATPLSLVARDVNKAPVLVENAVVTFTVAGVNTATVTTTFDPLTGTYSGSYIPLKAGPDAITANMSINGQAAVIVATQTSNVAIGAFAGSTNDIVSPIQITSPISFNVYPVDAGGNALTGLILTASITTPPNQVVVNPPVTEPTPGTYHVTYQPQDVGTFTVDVRDATQSILGTPVDVLVEAPLPVPANSIVATPLNGIAGQSSSMVLSARDANKMPVLADQAVVVFDITGKNPQSLTATFDKATGDYNASYTPTLSGIDTITPRITVTGQAQYSYTPTDSTVAPGPYFAATSSDTLVAGVVNAPMNFTLLANDANNNPIPDMLLTATVVEPGATAPLTLTVDNNLDGSYSVLYTPTIIGNHDFDVVFGATPQSLAGFPRTLAVAVAPPDPAKTSVTVSSPAVSGSPTSITVAVLDANNKPVLADAATVNITVSGANTEAVPLVTTFANSAYTASYTPLKSGDDLIAIDMIVNGVTTTLTGSPFLSTVGTGAIARASNSLQPTGSIYTPLDFDVTLYDANDNVISGLPLTATVAKNGNNPAPVEVSNNPDGSYRLIYTTTLPGYYSFELFNGTQSVTGVMGPITVTNPNVQTATLQQDLLNGLYLFSARFAGTDGFFYNEVTFGAGTLNAWRNYYWDTKTNSWLYNDPQQLSSVVLLGSDGNWGFVRQNWTVSAVDNATGTVTVELSSGGVVYRTLEQIVQTTRSLAGESISGIKGEVMQSALNQQAVYSPGSKAYGFISHSPKLDYYLNCFENFVGSVYTYAPNTTIDRCRALTNAGSFYTSLESALNTTADETAGPFLPVTIVSGSTREIQVQLLATNATDLGGTVIFYAFDPATSTRTELDRSTWSRKLAPSSTTSEIVSFTFTLPVVTEAIGNSGITPAEWSFAEYFFTLFDTGDPTGPGNVLRAGYGFAQDGVGKSLYAYVNSVASKDVFGNFILNSGTRIKAVAEDSDNDGIVDSLDQFPLDISRNQDTDLDGLADNVFYYFLFYNGNRRYDWVNEFISDPDDDNDGIPDVSDTCPFVANAANDPSVCDHVDGVYTGDFSETAADGGSTGMFANQCVGRATPRKEIFSIEDKGGFWLVNDEFVVPFNPLANHAYKSYIEERLDSVQSVDGPVSYTLSRRVDIDLNYDPLLPGITGTIVNIETGMVDANNVLSCKRTETLNSTFSYKHTGTERYDGTYGLETQESYGGVLRRRGQEVQFAFAPASNSMQVVWSDGGHSPYQPPMYNYYDPNTGRAKFFLNENYTRNNGGIDEVVCQRSYINGLFTTDPTVVVNNQVSLYGRSKRAERVYTGTLDTTLCNSSSTPSSTNGGEETFYAKTLAPDGRVRFARLNDGTAEVDRVQIGLANPEIIQTAKQPLYLQALDVNNTEICNISLGGVQGVGNFINITSETKSDANLVPINTDLLEFQNRPYGIVSCPDLKSLLSGGGPVSLTLNIIDAGFDGIYGTADDAPVSQLPYLANIALPAERFTAIPDRGRVLVNGAVPAAGAGATYVFGVFNNRFPLPIKWAILNQGENYYRIPVTAAGYRTLYDFPADLLTPINSANLPPGSFPDDRSVNMLIMARKSNTGVKPRSETRAVSQAFIIRPGLNGRISWTAIGATPVAVTDIATDGYGNVLSCVTPGTTTTNCMPASSHLNLNTAGEYASLDLQLGTATAGGPLLHLSFSDSKNATVTENAASNGTAIIVPIP